MKEKVREPKKRYYKPTCRLMHEIDAAVAEHYPGASITERQLFYLLQAKKVVKNKEKAYDRVKSTIDEMRYTGTLDWDAIVDPGRATEMHAEFADVTGALKTLASEYRTDWWDSQPNRVEVWFQKATIAEFLKPVTDKWHVRTLVTCGYVSDIVMKDAAERINAFEKMTFIIFIADHDPVAKQMMDDMLEKLETFGVSSFDLCHVTLTQQQVEQRALRTSRVKKSDPGARKFAKQHGKRCCEIDALDPKVLTEVVERAITSHIDNADAFKRHREMDRQGAERLRTLVKGL